MANAEIRIIGQAKHRRREVADAAHVLLMTGDTPELVNDLLDDEPRWSTRMMFADRPSFDEHWFNAGGLRDGLGGAARLSQECRESVVDFLEHVTGMTTLIPAGAAA